MTKTRRRTLFVGLPLVPVIALAFIEPSVFESTLRSPRALLVVGLTGAAISVGAAFVARRWGARAGGVFRLVVLGLVAWFLLVPSLRQTSLHEGLPTVQLATTTEGVAPTTPEFAEMPNEPGVPTSQASAVEEAPALTRVAPPAGAPPAAASSRPNSPTVTEVVPPTSSPPARPEPLPEPVPSPERLTTGQLVGIGHDASGTVSVFRLADGTAIVRFEEVDIKGAPDPVLYLVPGADRRSRDGGVEVAPLKATKGSFNHTIPASFDLDQPFTVFVWCERYATPIASADQRQV